MATLVILARSDKIPSFEQILETGIAPGYAIWKQWAMKITPGWTVVLLRKDKNKKRAEGILDRPLVPTNRYVNGVRRYDVHIKGLTQILPYTCKPQEKCNYFGVGVIGDC